MRRDGKVTFWVVLARWKRRRERTSDNEWFYHTDCNVPPRQRGTKWSYPYRIPNDDWNPTACGTCWQHWGFNGVMNEKAGIRWLNFVREQHLERHRADVKEDPEAKRLACEFRLFKRTMSRTTEEVEI